MKIIGCYFAIVAYMVLVILILYSRIYLQSQIVEGGNNDVLSHRPPNPQRRGLLIIGQGRSGTSFISKMFSKGLQVIQFKTLKLPNSVTVMKKASVLLRISALKVKETEINARHDRVM